MASAGHLDAIDWECGMQRAIAGRRSGDRPSYWRGPAPLLAGLRSNQGNDPADPRRRSYCPHAHSADGQWDAAHVCSRSIASISRCLPQVRSPYNSGQI